MTALTPLTSGDANDLGGAECVDAVHEGDTDVDFCGLAVGVAGDDAFAVMNGYTGLGMPGAEAVELIRLGKGQPLTSKALCNKPQ